MTSTEQAEVVHTCSLMTYQFGGPAGEVPVSYLVLFAAEVSRLVEACPRDARIYFYDQDDGTAVEWAGEFQSVQDLYRFFGWNKDTFQPGDQVTLVGNPDRREGHASMWVSEVVFADGSRVDVRNTP